MAILEAVFANKAGQTPQDVERRRKMAEELLKAGTGTKPPSSGLELAGRLAMTLTGQYQAGKADRQDATNRANASSLLANTLLGTPGQTGGSMPAVSPSGQIAAKPTSSEEWNTIAPRLVSDLSRDLQLSPEQAAGVVGQLGHESAGFSTLQEQKPMVPGSKGGFGYAQWTGPRRRQFEDWASANNLDPTSYEANYGFLKNELTNSPEAKVVASLRAAPDAQTAGRVFTDQFLRPGIPGYDSRSNWTNKALAFAKPQEVASLDQSIGMPGAASEVQRTAPQPPSNAMVSTASNQPAQAPQLPPPVNVASAPVPPNAPSTPAGLMSSQIPAEFQGSAQLMNADPGKGILPVLLGGSPASQEQVAQARALGNQPQAPSQTDRRAQIAALLQNPYTQEAGQQMLMEEYQRQQDAQNLILKQRLQQSDPKYRQDLEKGSIELENLRNPKISPAEQQRIDLERQKFDLDRNKPTEVNGRLIGPDGKVVYESPRDPMKVGAKETVIDPATGKVIYQPAPGQTVDFSDVASLRKEIQQLPSYKNLSQALPIYQSMAETAGRNSKASDLNLVYGLGKIMDPTSVVREGEMVMVKNTASIPDWFQGVIASLNGGAALTPETRQAIMTEAYGRIQGYDNAFKQDTTQYQGIVERNKFNPEDVIPSFGAYQPWKSTAVPEGDVPPAPEGIDAEDWKYLTPEQRRLWQK